jgi:dTDP-4-amino-4,6-dideoxygalactose transaminase
VTTSATSPAPDRSPDIPVFDLRIEDEDLRAVEETLRSGWLESGPRTEELERAFAAHLGTKHAVAVSSCTAALHLAYLAAGVGPGDEVIVPSLTFAATASAAVYCGARPVFADIEGLERPSIDPADVERKLTEQTKAVVAVHFGGYAAAVDQLADLCSDRGIALIEDAAHTPSATLDGRKLGTFGLAGAFSLFSNKVLAVGEGGFLVTADDRVATLARSLRSQGLDDAYASHHDAIDGTRTGFNYRFDDVRSALCLSRLPRLEDDIEVRRELTFRYRELFAGTEGIRVPYADAEVATSSAYVMPIFLSDPDLQPVFRERLRDRHGIQTTVLYPPVHLFSAYRERFPTPALPKTELAGRTIVVLPMFTHLTSEQQHRVVQAVKQELRG